ncbi:MAG: DUF805 domain-containing protein [Agromyces sp.]
MTTPASTPTYSGLSFGQAVRSAFANYANFTGRATRSEFWYFFLFTTLIGFVLTVASAVSFGFAIGPTLADSTRYVEPDMVGMVFLWVSLALTFAFALALIIPSFSVTIRRLHDAGYSGWLWLLNFIPSVGSVVLLVFMCLQSSPVDNQWGLAPVKR